MAGAKTLTMLCFTLMCFVCGALAVPYEKQASAIQCPDDQNTSSVAVIYANPANCSTFFECDNGEAKLLECSPGTFFSSKYDVCTFKSDSDCPDSELEFLSLTLSVADADDNRDNVNFKCPDEPDNTTSTYYPNTNNCSTFYECSNGVPVLMECPRRLYFNAKVCVCTVPKKSGCTQPDDDYDGNFLSMSDDFKTWSGDDWAEMKDHLERVYSGKCKKQDDGDNDGDGDKK